MRKKITISTDLKTAQQWQELFEEALRIDQYMSRSALWRALVKYGSKRKHDPKFWSDLRGVLVIQERRGNFENR